MRRSFSVRTWLISITLAIGAGIVAWKIAELIFPYDPLALLSLRNTTADFQVLRCATGLIFFYVLKVILALEWAQHRIKTLGNRLSHRLDPDDISKIYDVLATSSRVALAGYFVIFWMNYLPHRWFTGISRIIGTYEIEFWQSFGSITMIAILGGYLIITEPWRVLFGKRLRFFLSNLGVYLLISLPLYALGMVNFILDRMLIISISLICLMGFILLIFYNKRNSQLTP